MKKKTDLIDLPPDLDGADHRAPPRSPGLWIAIVAAATLIAAFALTARAADSENAAETTATEAVELSVLVSAACAQGHVPPQFREACRAAQETRQRVEEVTGTEAPVAPPG